MNEDKLRYFLKRVTASLHETRQRLQEVESSGEEPIAIVGMSCRFPGGVATPEDLWELLSDGRESVAELPRDRGWDVTAAEVREGNFVDDATGFDAGFFGISPREALSMDPQQRLLLEVAWEALERAGIDPASLRGSATGVFAGASGSGYGWLSGKQGEHDGHVMTGNATSILSGRISYTLGLEGPAVTVDTACSSSLVSLHLACQTLRSRECSMALVGGAFVAATPVLFTDFSTSLGLSPDGRCKTFGAGADGMGVAEGAGVVVVERLSDARRNGHRILAVVRGSAVNQDGASNGLTAPNGPSQQRVIRAALASARLSTEDVDVVEAHGTGTPLGDPIEAQALLATYGQGRPEGRPLWLGSVKSNIGHTQQAAGMAGIIKTVLSLRNQELPRTLHVEEPTTHVDWSAGDVRLLAEPVPWPAGERVRRAGVSAFGMSGTNVHIIVEEAPAAEATAPEPDAPEEEVLEVADERVPVLEPGGSTAWPVSGRSANGVAAQRDRLAAWVRARPELDPLDVGWSLAATRSSFEHRSVTIGGDLDSLLSGAAVRGVARSGVRAVFVFGGQGAQWVGMGRAALAESPVFAARFAECERALESYVDWSPREVLTGAAELGSAAVVQPLLWAVMVSFAAVWEAAGVTPEAVVGHSQGEVAAATMAGMLSLEDAARVVVARSRGLSGLSVEGSMVSVVAPVGSVTELVQRWGDRLSVAAVNGPAATVVSGDPEALAEFERELASRKMLRWRVPETDFVAHSSAVEPLEAVLADELGGISPRAGRVPMMSTVTGDWVSGEELGAGYWYRNLRQTVQFEDATRALLADGFDSFVEVSPHPVLTASVTETAEDAGVAGVVTVATVERDNAGAKRLLTAFAEGFVHGLPVDWTKILPVGTPVELPTYAFQHQRYWMEAASGGDGAGTLAETRFWAAVEDGDLAHLTEVLELEDERPVGQVLEALTTWRHRELGRAATENWRYRTNWTPVADPAPVSLDGIWMVLTADAADDLTASCVRALDARGAEVLVVELPDGVVTREEVTEFLDEALPGTQPAGVLSLLAIDETPMPEHPVLTRGLARTLSVAQVLVDLEVEAQLWVATQGALAAAAGDTVPNPVQVQAWGLGRVVGLEHPEAWGGLLDLPAELDDADGDRLAAVLAGCGEDQVAIRAGGLLGRRLARADRPKTTDRTWTPRGTALVTGGTGAIGGHVARWLTRRDAERVVLTSRSGPAAGHMPALAAELAAAGTRVDVVACDAGSRAELAGLLDWTARTGAAVSSVLHTAGIGQATTVAETDLAETAAVLAAKVAGAVHLDELTRDFDLDAFVLFSSISATWGSGLQPAYGAANTFLDSLAEQRRAAGLPATSVAWGSWGGGGMTDSDGAAQGIRRGLLVMDQHRAIEALGQILDGDEGRLTVADIDWARFAPPFTLRRPSPLIESLPEVREALDGPEGAAAADDATLRQELAGLSKSERNRLLVGLVQAKAADVLGYASPDEVEATRAFSDLGFDSLTSVELRNRLSAATGLALPATLLFDAPTPNAAAAFLLAKVSGTDETAAPAPVAAAVTDEPLAIVGMSCRYPGGVTGPEDLWNLVAAGTDAISVLPGDRNWVVEDMPTSGDGYSGKPVRSGGFVYDATGFDAGFFGISPREAVSMDPQQRLLLEVAWESLERAGIDPASLRGSATGVFAGASASGYGWSSGLQGELDGHLVTGISTSVVSGRVAYVMGLEGPAVTVDTACSSSLVALHLACQAVRSGECSLALAGGVMVAASPLLFNQFSRQMGLAPDGRCKPFGSGADGMGLSEGAGMLVVERLSDAERNGHRILAVVRGSAVNQDGASNGLTAPNGPSQQRVIRAALASARLSTEDVDVVEAHGTGTPLGDPIEAQALLATYGQGRPAGRPLWLGSVKSNIGHSQAAAGVAGVIKMVQALQNRELPRTLHADERSPHVDWASGEVRLLTENKPWAAEDRPRRAGVSSFGMSGTNAHLILEEAPEPVEAEIVDERVPVVTGGLTAWPVSGRSASGLAAQGNRLAAWIDARAELDPVDVGWSLAATRSAFEHRSVTVGGDLASLRSGVPVHGVARSGVRPVFVFGGQGAQWTGMGRALLDESPVFAARFAECERALASCVDWSAREVLLDPAKLASAVVVQPVLWAVMVSLAAVWEAAGVEPEAVVGHSQGEVAAATVAGMLSLEDAARVVTARSRGLSGLSVEGSMVSVVAPVGSVAELMERWGDRLSVAAVNGPAATVVSGNPEALAEFERELASRKMLRWRVPETDFVAHSSAVEPLEAVLADELGGISPQVGRVPMMSTVTGGWVSGEELDAGYWYRNLRQTVQFEDATRALLAAGFDSFVEVSPHPVLVASVTETAEDAVVSGVVAVGTVERDNAGAERLLTAFAEGFVHGLPVDWTKILPVGTPVELPTYAFQHQHYWLEPAQGGEVAGTVAEARFWAAVEGGDLAQLTEVLELDDQRPVGEVLEALTSWRHRELGRAATGNWRYRTVWAPITDPDPVTLDGTWAIVAPSGRQLASDCEAALRARGAEVLLLSPEDPIPGSELSGILSLLALDETPTPGNPALNKGLAATIDLVRALGDAQPDTPLWTVTSGAVATAPGTPLTNPVQAQVWGFGRVAALEHPHRWGGLLDLPATLDDRTAGLLAAVLAGTGEDQVAIRTAGIHGRRLERAPRRGDAAAPWMSLGTALITGGTGAIGGRVAGLLAARGAERLVLASRTGPSEGVVALVAGLAAQGADVEVVACDAGNRPDLAGLLDRIAVTGPALSSVVHAAGIGQFGAIADTDPAEAASVLAAKVEGARHLDELTRDADLDAFVLFSSISATWGSAMQSVYAAANAYLDALAENRAARGEPATSVAWGPWGGGGLTSEEGIAQLARGGFSILEPGQAIQVLAQLVDEGAAQTTVVDVDWATFAPTFTLRRRSPLVENLPEVRQALDDSAEGPAGDGGTDLAERLAGLSRAEQVRVLVSLVQAEAAAVLSYASADDVEATRAFSDLGFDSLTSVELRNRLGEATGLRLPATLLFDCPTPAAVADHLWSEQFQDEARPASLVEEVDRLGSLLTEAAPDEKTHELIAERLQSLLSRWTDAGARDGRANAAEKLESASDDEIFDFIHTELGR
ncbi:type I polyketide synthase [Amycolatopsis azurea]|uniref:type I polyketide synthase n=1 Tax=Amycolatopsis azurea TaxID=36819 RepID=UPI0038173CD6